MSREPDATPLEADWSPDGPIERGRWWRQRGPTVLPLRFEARPDGAAPSTVDVTAGGFV